MLFMNWFCVENFRRDCDKTQSEKDKLLLLSAPLSCGEWNQFVVCVCLEIPLCLWL